tara:strand:- start:2484 stop:3575 length:1092 start_codon:yes stop_codon:yes gene_type:complete
MPHPLWSSEEIRSICLEQGFARAGIASADPTTRREELEAWIRDGRHGSMAWMAEHLDVRADPGELVEGARSIICVLDRYADGTPDAIEPGWGRVARYARGRDYHVVMKSRLHAVCDRLRERAPDHVFRACVDTAPLLEREVAARAGLGSIGKHTLLIEPGLGSWLLIGAIVTTLELDRTGHDADHDPCGTCTRCIDACPTDAITPWSLDARRCVSAMTIEHRQPIDETFHEGMGDWIFGCDICQEVCPHNEPTARTRAAIRHESHDGPVEAEAGGRREDGAAFRLLSVLGWDETTRRAAFKGSSMKRAKLEMMRRNAVIAAGNSLREHDDPQLRTAVEALTVEGTDPMVRDAARAVLDSLDEV